MAILAGANVGPKNVGESKTRSNNNEGSCFFRKNVFGCFMALWSKPQAEGALTVNNNNRQQEGLQPSSITFVAVAPAAASGTPRSITPPRLSNELNHYPHLRRFTFSSLRAVTTGFQNRLGEGGFGPVFKGWVSKTGISRSSPGKGIAVAVKILNKNGLQGHREFVTEVNNLGGLDHPHLVKLIGYCNEGNERALVYEFLRKGSLEKHLFKSPPIPFQWSVRMKIMLGAAKGLAYLHEEAEKPLIYRDFKASNILLDEEYNAKLSDFGLTRDGPVGDFTHVSTRVLGTQGYAAPEYIKTGHLTAKSDVYSFGVVLLEMLTGRRSMDKYRPQLEVNLVEWVRATVIRKGEEGFHRVMDPRLEGRYSGRGAHKVMDLAFRCVSRNPKDRPLMSEVVEELSALPHYKEKIAPPSSSPPSRQTTPPYKGYLIVGSSSNNGDVYIVGTSKGAATPSRFRASPRGGPAPSPKANGGKP